MALPSQPQVQPPLATEKAGPALEEIAFALELNEPSTVFKGPEGFYIIKVTEIKEERQRLLSEVYSDIEQGLMLQKQEEAYNTMVGNLRKSASILIHDNLLKE